MRAVCLDLHFMEEWEVRCENWTGHMMRQLRNWEEFPGGEGEAWPKGSHDDS